MSGSIRSALFTAKNLKLNPSPTEAQKEAGNYKKHHVKMHGLDISLENMKGGKRSGVGPNGRRWTVTMPAHYGYIKRTQGADGDHVDVYVGPDHASTKVYIVDQKNAETGSFDEHKVLLGFKSEAEARATYLRGFSDGKGAQRLGQIHAMSMDDFKHWLKGNTTKPLGRIGRANGGPVDREGNLERFIGDNHPAVPRVLYHGTRDDITEFRHDHPHKKDAGWLGRGFYFTDSKPLANSYAMIKPGAAENVMPVHVSLKNPFMATMDHKMAIKNAIQNGDEEAPERFRQYLESKGHDGVILNYGDDKGSEYVVLHPEQIKSAIGNNGEFDPTNADITKADGGDVEGDDGIIAYHGSPHSFDKFDISKIGTGEGAQAYGHGLYFAENEGVAKGYRDRLTIDQTNSPIAAGKGYESNPDVQRILSEVKRLGLPVDNLNDLIKETGERAQRFAGAGFQKDAKTLGDLQYDLIEHADKFAPAGNMYEVHIAAHPDHFLDWDKPLSEQPDVLDRLSRYYAGKVGVSPEMAREELLRDTGSSFYRNEASALGGTPPGTPRYTGVYDQAKATGQLKEAGIPGIKYLDAGSRGAGEGTRNYVVFDDKLIKVRRKYAKGGAVSAGSMHPARSIPGFHIREEEHGTPVFDYQSPRANGSFVSREPVDKLAKKAILTARKMGYGNG